MTQEEFDEMWNAMSEAERAEWAASFRGMFRIYKRKLDEAEDALKKRDDHAFTQAMFRLVNITVESVRAMDNGSNAS